MYPAMYLYLAAATAPPAPAPGGVSVTPNIGDGPGGEALQKLVNWSAGVGLLVCLAALIIAGATFGFAHRNGMTGTETASKRTAAWALGGALVIGAAASRAPRPIFLAKPVAVT